MQISLMNFRPSMYALAMLLMPAVTHAADITSETLPYGLAIIRLTGEIKHGDEERFRQISLKHPKAAVHLQSVGGAIVPALEIGRIIRIAGYDTVVPQNTYCTSSCALIWMAGTNRYLHGAVGFHAAYRDLNGQLQESGAANALIGNYLTLFGFSAKAILFKTDGTPYLVIWINFGI